MRYVPYFLYINSQQVSNRLGFGGRKKNQDFSNMAVRVEWCGKKCLSNPLLRLLQMNL